MKYKINKGFIAEKIEGKTIIFDEKKSVLYTFNETASFIFKKLKKGLPENEIVQGVARKYQVKEEKVKKDFKDLLSDLKKKKIIS